MLQEAALAEGNAGDAAAVNSNVPSATGDHAWGGVAFGTGAGMLRHSRDIFTEFPARLVQKY